MSYTSATVIIAAADQAAAQVDFPGSFVSGFYEATEGADPTVVTHYVCAGLWADEDLARITDGSVAWPSQVYHDEVGAVLAQLCLSPVDPAPLEPSAP